jgi:ABC-type branched-subunit amino acid transport system ATPase component
LEASKEKRNKVFESEMTELEMDPRTTIQQTATADQNENQDKMVFDDPSISENLVVAQMERNEQEEAGKISIGSFHEVFYPLAPNRIQQVGKAQKTPTESEQLKLGGNNETNRTHSHIPQQGSAS